MKKPLQYSTLTVCTLKGTVASFSCWDDRYIGSKQAMHCMLCMFYMSTMWRQRIKACKAFNAMYVDTVNTEHIHTFLPMTFLIFKCFQSKKVLESWDSGLFNLIKCYVCWSILKVLKVIFDFDMYVNTVNVSQNQFNIKKVMGKNVHRVCVLCINGMNLLSIECIRNPYGFHWLHKPAYHRIYVIVCRVYWLHWHEK